jgi:hypothetical protein
MDNTSVKLAPSILSAVFANLGEHRIHVDIMDGHCVPNITIRIRRTLGEGRPKSPRSRLVFHDEFALRHVGFLWRHW